VGFGRTPRQDVVRVGGGTHRSYLAAMEAAGRRGRGRGPYHRTILWLERRMFAPRGHRRILAVSQRVADEVTRDYGVAPDRIRVLYNGVDLERFHPRRRLADGPRLRTELGLGSRPVCVAIGTGFVRKGFDLLLDCWREGPPAGAALVLVGDDERLRATIGAPRPRELARIRARCSAARRRRNGPRRGRRALPTVAAGSVRERRPRSRRRRRPGRDDRGGAPPSCSTGPLAELVIAGAVDASSLRRTITRALTGGGRRATARAAARRAPPVAAPPGRPSRRSCARWPMPPETRPPRAVRHGALRACLAAELDVARVIGPDGDPDRLLTSPRCELRKFQEKVVVGRIETPRGWVYVKRYNVHALRVLAGSLFRRSPAMAAFENAGRLAALGVAVPHPLAAIEYRRAGLLRRSFFLTDEVAGAVTADVAWQPSSLARPRPAGARGARSPRARRILRRPACARRLPPRFEGRERAGAGLIGAPSFVLLDLERVAIGAPVAAAAPEPDAARPHRRRRDGGDRLRLGPTSAPRARGRRAWVARSARSSKRIAGTRRASTGPHHVHGRLQDEAAQIAHALESVTWCDEVVVVDGGSRDATAEIARQYTARVLHNPWPGYRAQKQFALDASTSDWVLNLDADERVSDELANEIRRELARVPGDVDGSRSRLARTSGAGGIAAGGIRAGWFVWCVVRTARGAARIRTTGPRSSAACKRSARRSSTTPTTT
jgi:hypothetical protein